MRILVLGPIEVVHGGLKIELRGHLQRALVAALASEAGHVLSAERLIDTLWGESPPAAAKTKLQGHVSGIRNVFCGALPGRSRASSPLLTREPGYLLSDDEVAVDLTDYRTHLSRAADELTAGKLAVASSYLGEALALWRGPAYADASSRALRDMAVRLEHGRLLTVERKATCDLQLGRNDVVAEDLALILADQPLREGARAGLMLALYRLGCRADALAVYRSGCRLLRDELGIVPGRPLQRLHELMLSDAPELATLAWLPS
jgi:DNA-binding SARP family transcriptional activator